MINPKNKNNKWSLICCFQREEEKYVLAALGGLKDVFAKNLSVYTKKVKLRDICAESQTISSCTLPVFIPSV